ncbi:MAG TPA: hypothetical protein VHU19_05795 [Pyrinomonadaceae bacterium]|nr:hypothetical protein [Pyrinomonadaceae bacterium]
MNFDLMREESASGNRCLDTSAGAAARVVPRLPKAVRAVAHRHARRPDANCSRTVRV